MISTKEKALIHIYADAAGLQEAEYRALLRDNTGHNSCAAQTFSHYHCDIILAVLEAVLFDRVAESLVSDPRGSSRYIRDEFYFRSRLQNAGKINARQFRLIQQLWNQLSEFLEDGRSQYDYLTAITVQAIGKAIPLQNLSSTQAGMVINALRDRFAGAMRSIKQKAMTSPMPF